MIHRQSVLSIAGLALIAVLGATKPASAVPITEDLTDADATSAHAKYKTTRDSSIGVTYNATDVGMQQGTVTINATWGVGDFTGRVVTFTQREVPGDEFGATQGLRLQLVLTLGNNTGKSWDAFEITTEDNSVPVPVGSEISSLQGGHKFLVHFHPGTLTQNPMDFMTVSAFNNQTSIELSDGLHGAGDLTLSNFFLHERNLKNEQNQAVTREFLLFLTPHPAAVSEPGSWALLALGGLVLIVQRASRRTRVRRIEDRETSSRVTLSGVCQSSP